jgi:hypothetical protein
MGDRRNVYSVLVEARSGRSGRSERELNRGRRTRIRKYE